MNGSISTVLPPVVMRVALWPSHVICVAILDLGLQVSHFGFQISDFRSEISEISNLPTLLPSFGSHRTNDRSSLPHFGFANCLQFLLELFAVVGAAVRFQNAARFFAPLHLLIQLFKNWFGRVAESCKPVQSSTLCRGRTVGVHPVHAVFANQRVKTLRSFFHRFVERFSWRMTVCT